MSESRFDPSKYLRKLQGQEYLEVKWRLVWLRSEHSDAKLETELVHLDMENFFAVFKATVTLPNGASATGFGSESRQDFKDFLEKAETKAVGRALGMLGYGTQFSHDFDEEPRQSTGQLSLADSPVSRRGAPAPTPMMQGNGHGVSHATRPAPVATADEQPAPAASTSGVLATAAQVRLIFQLARNNYAMNETQVEERCRQQFGVLPQELTKRQASEFIEKLKSANTNVQ